MSPDRDTVSIEPVIPMQPRAPAPAVGPDAVSAGLMQAAVLGVWVACMVVGVLGFVLPYPREYVPLDPPPVVAQFVQVALPAPPPPAPARAAEEQAAPSRAEAAPPPPVPDIAPPPEAPALTAVAEPGSVAFAVPVEGPVRLVDPKHAGPPPAQIAQPRHPVRHLTLGVGEGNQANPEYPPEAARARQQGVVRVQFTVGEDGRVVAAELAAPSRWPLLNQAALREIRNHWSFRAGPVRTYDVSIEFKLSE